MSPANTAETAALSVLLGFAREELEVYATAVFPTFEAPAHLKQVIAELEAVERGDVKRLMIFMPPRHGKSLTVSQIFPAWFLGRNPGKYVISTTYGDDLSSDFGRAVRNFVASPQHQEIFPDALMSEDTTSAQRFTTKSGGAFFSVGRGGPITGRGAHLLIVDDPFKDSEEASSEAVRRKLKDWFRTVAYTRLMPGGAIVIATTRWHVDDLPGWLLDEAADENWKVVSFPAIAEKDEEFRKEGEALWPERYPLSRLRAIRKLEGSTNWMALYQQQPVLDGGFMFKREWFNRWSTPPEPGRLNRYMLVDPASSKKRSSDLTAMFVVGLGADSNIYVLDMVYDRLNLTERVKTVMALHRIWKPKRIGYEEYGMMADIEALQEKQKSDNYRFEVVPLKGRTAKIERIKRLQPYFEEARVWFPEDLHKSNTLGLEEDLVETFLKMEYVKYPASQHDDMLDALSRIVDPDFPAVWPRVVDEMIPFDPLHEDTRDRYLRKLDARWSRRQRRGSWMSA